MGETMTPEDLQTKYKNCNLLLPSATTVMINPFYKCSVIEISVDISDNSGDIFPVGKAKTGEDQYGRGIFKDVYSLAKPFLMKLATAAGIQFHPDYTKVTRENANTFIGRAYGAVRLPDGTFKTHAETKRFCLDDEEAKMRLEYMDKSIMGIYDSTAARKAANMFDGEWKEDTKKLDRNNRPTRYYAIADSDREKYIERSMLVAMTQLRKTISEKAQTGAILRVVRALLGVKGTYTIEELKKPFAVLSVNFQPDYSDTKVRNALLQQGMRAMGSLFGTGSVATNVVPFSNEVLADTESDMTDLEEGFAPLADEDNPFLEENKGKFFIDESINENVQEPEKQEPERQEPEKPAAKKPENVQPENKAAGKPKQTEPAVKESKESTEKDKKQEAPVPFTNVASKPKKMTVKQAKQFRLPDSDPSYGGHTLEEVINQPGGIDYLKQLHEGNLDDVDLASAVDLLLKAIEYIQKQQQEQKAS